MIDYYARIAPRLLPHLHERPVTRKRWPNGVESAPFFEKNTPAGTPSWVRDPGGRGDRPAGRRRTST